jgi:hypothetical protein
LIKLYSLLNLTKIFSFEKKFTLRTKETLKGVSSPDGHQACLQPFINRQSFLETVPFPIFGSLNLLVSTVETNQESTVLTSPKLLVVGQEEEG